MVQLPYCCQEVSRCHTRGESRGMCNMYTTAKHENAVHSGFETQSRRHQKSKTGVSVAHKKDLCRSKLFLKKEKEYLFCADLILFSQSFNVIISFVHNIVF